MISFAVVVVLIHVMQTFWFGIAFKKRLDLENLDKKAAISYLKTRMAMHSQQSTKILPNPVSTTDTSSNKISLNEKKHLLIATTTSSNVQATNKIQHQIATAPVTMGTLLKPAHLERTRNLESTDLEDSPKISPNHSDTSLNSLGKANVNSLYMNNRTNINYIEDSNSSNLNSMNLNSRKASASYYTSGDNQNSLGYQYIPLIHQSSRDS